MAFIHAGVVDVATGTVRRDRMVSVDRGRIVSVTPSAGQRVPPGVRTVDATGEFLIPGLWDAHVHLSYLGACALPVLLANGITTVRDAGARMDEVVAWRARIANDALVGPRIRAAGPNIESGAWLDLAYQIAPPNDAIWRWGPRLRMNGPADAAAIVDTLARLGVDFIKFRNLPRTSFLALAAAAQQRGMRLAGHAPKGITLREAAAAGLGSVEHAETVTLALDSAADPERLAMFRAVAKAGTFITPTLITEITLWLTRDSVARAILADSNGTRDPWRRYVSRRALGVWEHVLALNKQGADPDANWKALYRRQVADVRLAHQAGVAFLVGTDLGSPVGLYPGASLHEELALLVRDGGLTPAEALRAATMAPAKFFGIGAESGVVAAGMVADLVLLDANPLADIANTRRIRAVMIGGRLFDRAALDATLANVARQARSGADCE